MDQIELRSITATVARLLRESVLRPGLPTEESAYPLDEAEDTLHMGAYSGTELVGIASVFREPAPGSADPGEWRLRGMATLPEHRGQGIGAGLLAACCAHIAGLGGQVLWCNARTTVAGFYEQAGFEPASAIFELPGIGPHVRMRRFLAPSQESRN